MMYKKRTFNTTYFEPETPPLGTFVKLPAYRMGLPGNEISFLFVPLDPAYKAGLSGHLPVT
jgi:hypothetical protein